MKIYPSADSQFSDFSADQLTLDCYKSLSGLDPPAQLTGYSRNPHPEPPARLRCTVPAQSSLSFAGPHCWLHGIPQHFLSGCHPDSTHEISEFLQGTRITRLFLQGTKSGASNCLGRHSPQHLAFPVQLGQSILCHVSAGLFQHSANSLACKVWFCTLQMTAQRYEGRAALLRDSQNAFAIAALSYKL